LKDCSDAFRRTCNCNGRTHPHASKDQQLELIRFRPRSTQPLQEWGGIFQRQGKRAFRRHASTMSIRRSQVNASDAGPPDHMTGAKAGGARVDASVTHRGLRPPSRPPAP
jgi:hypothetical protein